MNAPIPASRFAPTAGGILMCAAPEKADALLAALRETYPQAAIVGRVKPNAVVSLEVR